MVALVFAASSFVGPIFASEVPDTVRQKISTLAVPFVPNAGQWDRRAAFKANTLGGALFVTTEGALVYSFPGKSIAASVSEGEGPRGSRARSTERGSGSALTETLTDARGLPRPLQPAGLRPSALKVSFMIGGGVAQNELPMPAIDTFERVQLGEVYPGVNLQLRATGNNVEKIFTVAPASNPQQIQIKLEGADRLEITHDGQLVAHTGNGPITFTAPIAFQEDAHGMREPVSVAYVLDNDEPRYGFTLGRYDPTRPLIIDPLLQSTYLGGNGVDVASAVAVHPISGDIIVAGYSQSINFPVTPGGVQPASGGGQDAFVSRFNATLTGRLQSTYFGGSGDDVAYAVAIHPTTGDVYIAGSTTSTDLPGTSGAAQAANSGLVSGFVVRFNGALTSRLQTTYLGGGDRDIAYAMAIHPMSGEVYVAGSTRSGSFPSTIGGAQPPGVSLPAIEGCGFISRFDPALTNIIQSTYVCSGRTVFPDGPDIVKAIAIHPTTGEVYVTGDTQSFYWASVRGAAQSLLGGFPFADPSGRFPRADCFVSRFNAELTRWPQVTYLGGSGDDRCNAIAIHPMNGDVYVVGTTDSTLVYVATGGGALPPAGSNGLGNLPGSSAGAQPYFGGGASDAFVGRLNAALTTIVSSSYIGGIDTELGQAIAIHPKTGEVYIGGMSGVGTTDLGTVGGAQSTHGGSIDGFVARFDAALSRRLQATYLGGGGPDYVNALAFHPTGELIIAGYTSSFSLPGRLGGAQPGFSGGLFDGYVSRMTPDLTLNDSTPDAFSFASQYNAPIASARTSNAVQVGGLSDNTAIYVDGGWGGSYCVSSVSGCSCDLSGGFVSTLGTVANGNYVCARLISPGSNDVQTRIMVHIGAAAANFSVTTGSQVPACTLDVDGDGSINAYSDGLMLLRAMLGFTGTNVTNGAIVGTPPRNTWALIRPYLNANCGTSFLP